MVFYFACWFTLAHFLNKWSREEDRGGNLPLWMRMEGLSGGGLVLFGFTVNFAAVDWVMSLEPRWYSTIYGLLLMIGMTLAAMAFVDHRVDLAFRQGAAFEGGHARATFRTWAAFC